MSHPTTPLPRTIQAAVKRFRHDDVTATRLWNSANQAPRPGVSAHGHFGLGACGLTVTKASRRLQAPRPFLKLGLNGPFFAKKKLMVVFTSPGHILSQKRMIQIGPEIGKLAMMRHQAPRQWGAQRPGSAHTVTHTDDSL